MPKKEKTLRDLDLLDLIRKLRQSINALHMYSDPSIIEKLLANSEFREKFVFERNEMKLQMDELSKRFNAPANYDADQTGG